MMTTNFDANELCELHSQIQRYLRSHALAKQNHERSGPFLIGFDAGDPNPFRNYAVPDDGAAPSAADIEALVVSFTRRNRKPRLEYIAAAAPAVEPTLIARGFAVEKRFP